MNLIIISRKIYIFVSLSLCFLLEKITDQLEIQQGDPESHRKTEQAFYTSLTEKLHAGEADTGKSL